MLEINVRKSFFVTVAFVAVVILAACAPYSSDISPAHISSARYNGLSCSKLAKVVKYSAPWAAMAG